METTMTSTRPRGYRGLPLEGVLARWYAKTTLKDLGEFRRLAAELAGRLGPGSAVLEVAPGPGYLAIELARLGAFRIVGLDISRSFVRMAGENARRAGVSVDFRHGNAADMPLDSGAFDLVVCRAAFKNFREPVRALDEMHRVLRPGGESLIVDLRKDVRPEAIDTYVADLGLGRFDTFMTRLIFRRTLIPRAYTSGQFREMAAASAFGGCRIDESAIGLNVTLRR